MDINNSNLTTMYESIFAQIYVLLAIFTIFAFYHEIVFKPQLQILFSYKKYVYLGKHTLIHCSQRTVVHVYVNDFL